MGSAPRTLSRRLQSDTRTAETDCVVVSSCRARGGRLLPILLVVAVGAGGCGVGVTIYHSGSGTPNVTSPYPQLRVESTPQHLPPALSLGDTRAPLVTPSQATVITKALWNAREDALVHRNLGLIRQIDTMALAGYDEQYLRSLQYGLDKAIFVAPRPVNGVTVFVPRQSAWPEYFAAEVACQPGAGPGKATDLLLATRTSPETTWHLAFEIGNDNRQVTQTLPPPETDPEGFDLATTPAPKGPTSDWLGDLAQYYASWKDVGASPAGSPFAPGALTTEMGPALTAHPQGALVDGGDIRGTYRFTPEDQWLVGFGGWPVVCGDVYETVTDSALSGTLFQAQSRSQWGADVPPGTYQSVVSVYDVEACIFPDASVLGVYGDPITVIGETGYH